MRQVQITCKGKVADQVYGNTTFIQFQILSALQWDSKIQNTGTDITCNTLFSFGGGGWRSSFLQQWKLVISTVSNKLYDKFNFDYIQNKAIFGIIQGHLNANLIVFPGYVVFVGYNWVMDNSNPINKQKSMYHYILCRKFLEYFQNFVDSNDCNYLHKVDT